MGEWEGSDQEVPEGKKKTDISELFMYYFDESRVHCPVDGKLFDF